jgi:hypothetical protein
LFRRYTITRLKNAKIYGEFSFEILASLVKGAKDHLTKIKTDLAYDNVIKTIYQNCPKLRYCKLSADFDNFTELENLLINCQYLEELVLDTSSLITNFDFDCLSTVVAKSSPINLVSFTFMIGPDLKLDLESLKLFFDKRIETSHVITIGTEPNGLELGFYDLIEQYKLEGVIKEFDHY